MTKFRKFSIWVISALLMVSITPIMAQDTTESDCEAGFRLFDHEMLASDPICIPENPQRVLALEISALETALLADIEVVGTANWLHDEIPVILPELATALEGVTDTGYPANLEVALDTTPDIILATDGDIDVEAGSEIAPLVMVTPDYDWKLMMQFWSEVLGTEDLYDDMIANYEARITELQDALGDEDPEISIIGASSYGAYMWLIDTAPGYIVTDAGLSRTASQNFSGEASVAEYDAERWIALSEERFDLADGDHIFVFTYATTDPETLETELAYMEDFQANPVWNTLSAVQAGNVHYVGPHWWRAQTYLLASKVIDDLFTSLTDTTASTPTIGMNTEPTVECEAGLRGIVDSMGTALCLPENPERIVTLADGDTDALITLGVDPVGISNGRGSQTPPRYLLDYLPEEYVSVGTFFQPSMETVLSLEPDLILFSSGQFAEPEMLEQLNAIAPVFVPSTASGAWQEPFIDIGKALNMESEVEAYIAEYDSRVAEISATVEPETQFIISRWSAEGPQIMGPQIFAPAILQEVGLVMPADIPEYQAGHPHSAPLSLEALEFLDADWAFVGTLQAEGDAAEALEAVFENPLFQQLEVVQNDHVVVIDGSIWTSSGGPLAANLVLDVVAENLGGE